VVYARRIGWGLFRPRRMLQSRMWMLWKERFDQKKKRSWPLHYRMLVLHRQ
jgi:hypothetical protein